MSSSKSAMKRTDECDVCGKMFHTVNAYNHINQHRRSFYLRGLVVLHCQSRPELMLLLLRVRTCPLQQYSGFQPNGRAVQRIWITFAYLAYFTYSVLVKKSQNGPTPGGNFSYFKTIWGGCSYSAYFLTYWTYWAYKKGGCPYCAYQHIWHIAHIGHIKRGGVHIMHISIFCISCISCIFNILYISCIYSILYSIVLWCPRGSPQNMGERTGCLHQSRASSAVDNDVALLAQGSKFIAVRGSAR